jgi:hypothetical protein
MRKLTQILLLGYVSALCLAAQSPSKSSNSSPSPSGGGGGLSGIVYLAADVPAITPTLPAAQPRQTVLCFTMKSVRSAAAEPTSAAQPVVLEPAATADPFFHNVCSPLDDAHPLLSGSTLVIAVDSRNISNRANIKAVALNVTFQAGTSVTTAPVRGSMAPGAPSAAGTGAATLPLPPGFYMAWPVRLSGDTVPTVTVSALYRPEPAETVVVTNTSPAPVAAPPAPTPPATTTVDTTTTATPAPDQVVTMLSLQLSQVHPLYYYNIATGVVVSSVRNPSFYRVPMQPTSTGAAAAYTTVADPGSRQVAPVLMFTGYILPFDAERNWNPRDLIPGLSFGFSLTAPASSFFFGGSFEIRRNIQFVAGLNLAKVNALAPAGNVDPSVSTAPATKQVFEKGPFWGITLNIDFIKGLFGGGGAKQP